MKPWVEEVVSALGAGESHSQPVMGLLLSLSLGIAIQTPLSLIRANESLMSDGEATPFIIFFFLAVAVVANVVSWRPASTYDTFNRPVWGITWSLVLGTVSAAIPIIAWSGMANALVIATLGVIGGAAFTFVLLFLGHLFTRTYIPDIVKRSFLASAAAVIIMAVVIVRLPCPSNYLVCAGLNILNSILLVLLHRNAPAIGDYSGFLTFRDRKQDAGLFIAKVALPLICAGTVLCLFQTHRDYVSSALLNPTILDDVNIVSYMIVEYVILCFTIYGVRRFGWPFAQLHSFLIPFVGLCGTICVGTAIGGQTVYDGGGVAIFALFMGLTWSFMGDASLEYLLRSASVYGMSIGSIAVGVLIGCALNLLNLHGTAAGGILGALICLIMAIGFLPARPAPNLSHSTYSTPLRSLAVKTPSDQNEEEAEQPVEDEEEEASETTFTSSPSEKNPTKGRFMRRCDAVARTFLLSNRESEVLVLLAKGRSMSHIMEELVISEGTAKTHINHVYKKLDVHSRHELVDLIESMDIAEY